MTLIDHDPWEEKSSMSVKVPFDVFLTKWSVFRGDPPEKVVGDWGATWEQEFGAVDAAKAILANAMRAPSFRKRTRARSKIPCFCSLHHDIPHTTPC